MWAVDHVHLDHHLVLGKVRIRFWRIGKLEGEALGNKPRKLFQEKQVMRKRKSWADVEWEWKLQCEDIELQVNQEEKWMTLQSYWESNYWKGKYVVTRSAEQLQVHVW